MKLFELKRGCPSTVVAQGAVFDNGKAVVAWLGSTPSVGVYDSVAECLAVHSHGSNIETVFTWDPGIPAKYIAAGMDMRQGVFAAAEKAGDNMFQIADDRDWFARLFDRVPLK